MALTWDQFGNLGLSAAQKNKLEQFRVIGSTTNPDISGVTWKQAKEVDIFARDVQTLLGVAQIGARYVKKLKREEAGKAADDAVVPDPF